MLEGREIICFAPNDWWTMNPSCTTHIMLRLARKNKVLFVNPFSSDLSGGPGNRRGLPARVIRKAKSIAKFLRRPYKNLFVFSPVFVPFHGGRVGDELNNRLLKIQIKSVCRLIGISRPILWMENPRAADLMNLFEPEMIIYHVSDLFSECGYIGNREILKKREQEISGKSDLLICVSQSLYELKASQRANVRYLPHGVDFELFHRAAQKEKPLSELAGIPGPIAGYFGTMTANNDIELLEYCVEKLSDVSFVFAGQITGGDYSRLLKMPNFHHLGRLPYEKIPALCVNLDVCLLQWRKGRWIENCNPLKLFEYMASGKPIVSVPINEVVNKYSELVSVAATKEEFCEAIRWELNNDTQSRAQARERLARQHNWDNHVEIISGWIAERVGAKRKTDFKVA